MEIDWWEKDCVEFVKELLKDGEDKNLVKKKKKKKDLKV
jgi:hypothetical protein